jgi:hypothetical protein
MTRSMDDPRTHSTDERETRSENFQKESSRAANAWHRGVNQNNWSAMARTRDVNENTNRTPETER